MPGLIAMVSVLAVVGIEMFFATRGAGHVHGSAYDTVPDIDGDASHGYSESNGGFRPGHQRQGSLGRRFGQGDMGLKPASGEIALGELPIPSDSLTAGQSPLTGTASSPLRGNEPKCENVGGEEDEDLDLDDLDPSTDASGLLSQRRRGMSFQGPSHEPYHLRSHSSSRLNHTETGGSHAPLSDLQQQQKMLLQCLLLEAGILFHSVFIGMALSVATGTSFVVLLVAISFHRKRNFLNPLTFNMKSQHNTALIQPYRNLRRHRPRRPHCSHNLLLPHIPKTLAHGPRLWRHHASRPSYRSPDPQPVRPSLTDGLADGRCHERDQ
jgi:zinc transporter 1/2/3